MCVVRFLIPLSQTVPPGLIDVLSIAKELQEKMTVHDRDVTELETLIKRIPELPNNPFTKGGFRFSAPWAVKGCTLYHTHLNRLPLSRALQQGERRRVAN